MDHEMTADYIIAPPKADLRTQREIILAALVAAHRDGEREQMESLRKQIGELRPTGNSNTYHCGYEDARDDAIAVIRKQQAAADRSAGKDKP